MRRLRPLRYFVGQAWRQLVRDRALTSTAVLANIATLFISALFLLIAFNLQQALDSIRSQREVQVFLETTGGEPRWQQLATELGLRVEIAEAILVTPDEGLAEFEAEFGESGLRDALGENPLPPAVRVTMAEGYRTPQAITALVDRLSRLPGVESVQYGGRGIAKVEARVRTFATLNLIVGLLTGLSAILIVANTIRLTILARSELVAILKLIGARDSFVRWPFLLEGSLQGIVAGLGALVALWGVHQIVSVRLAGILFFSSSMTTVFLVFATLLGGAGALVATLTPLRVHWRRG